jgi:hypothetical protein
MTKGRRLHGHRRASAVTAAALACLAAAALLLGGCGGSDSSPVAPLVAACARIPIQRVDAIVRAAGGDPSGIRRRSGGSALLSRCSFRGPGANLQLSLDAERHAVRGYFNRMTEFTQFSSGGRDLGPRPVAGIGDRGTPGYGAYWVPALDELFSVRRRRALIATFFVHGAPQARNRAGAIALTRLAYAALGVGRDAGNG